MQPEETGFENIIARIKPDLLSTIAQAIEWINFEATYSEAFGRSLPAQYLYQMVLQPVLGLALKSELVGGDEQRLSPAFRSVMRGVRRAVESALRPDEVCVPADPVVHALEELGVMLAASQLDVNF